MGLSDECHDERKDDIQPVAPKELTKAESSKVNPHHYLHLVDDRRPSKTAAEYTEAELDVIHLKSEVDDLLNAAQMLTQHMAMLTTKLKITCIIDWKTVIQDVKKMFTLVEIKLNKMEIAAKNTTEFVNKELIEVVSDESDKPEEALINQAKELHAQNLVEAGPKDAGQFKEMSRNQYMKAQFALCDRHKTGLMSKDLICKLILSCGVDLELSEIAKVLDPHSSTSNPNMIKYIPLVDSLWPEARDSHRARVMQQVAEDIDKSASPTGVSKMAQQDELHLKVETELGDAEANAISPMPRRSSLAQRKAQGWKMLNDVGSRCLGSASFQSFMLGNDLCNESASSAFSTLLKHSSAFHCSGTNLLSKNNCMEAAQQLKLDYLGEAEMDRIWNRFPWGLSPLSSPFSPLSPRQESTSSRERKEENRSPADQPSRCHLQEMTCEIFCAGVERSEILKGFASQVTARAASLEFQVPSAYNYDLSTSENYKLDSSDFNGPYAYARAGGQPPQARDYAWHNNYTSARQSWQDCIVRLATSRHSRQSRPWIVFSCGAMGCGKGFTFATMSSRGYFPIENIVRIDPDFFKVLMPEWEGYVAQGKDAGTLCHKESGYIQELCQEVALKNSQNIWVDGSLRDTDWFRIVFEDIRKRYPHYRIGIIYVNASECLVRQRIQKRLEATGRGVPEDKLQASILGSKKSVFELSSLCNWIAYVRNDSDPMLESFNLLDRTGDWQHMTDRFADCEPAAHEFPKAHAPMMLMLTASVQFIDVQGEPTIARGRTVKIVCGRSQDLQKNTPRRSTFVEIVSNFEASVDITPSSRITIPEGAAGNILRCSMGIPEKAVWIAYAMPQRKSTVQIVRCGGFVFFDKNNQFLDVFLMDMGHQNSVCVSSFQFAAPVEKQRQDIPQSLLSDMRWTDIAIPILMCCGAQRCAWVCDSELPEANNMGGFLYAFAKEKFVFFPVRVPSQ